VVDNGRETVQQLSANLLLRMAVELAEVEGFGECDPGSDFERVEVSPPWVPLPFKSLKWADQDLGGERDELPGRLVAFVATLGVLAPRLTLGVEVAPNDVDQLIPCLGTHKVGE